MLNDRFWTKVDREDPSGCWVWTANKNNKGYGLFRPGGVAPKALAHRLSYEDEKGPIPKGLFILHSCDNPACVNPSHLRVGTPKENVADMDARMRRASHSPKGASNPNSRLTSASVIEIRKDYVSGASAEGLARHFRVTKATINDVVSGISWQHLIGLSGSPTLEQMRAALSVNKKTAARLSPENVSEIKKRLSSGEQGKALAIQFGVHKTTISDIKRGKIWRDVP